MKQSLYCNPGVSRIWFGRGCTADAAKSIPVFRVILAETGSRFQSDMVLGKKLCLYTFLEVLTGMNYVWRVKIW